MNRFLLMLLCGVFTFFVHAQNSAPFVQNFSQHWSDMAYEATYTEQVQGECQVSFAINNVDVIDVVKGGTTYSKISFASSTVTEKKGWAELPYVSASIQLPADRNVSIARIEATDVVEFAVNHPILPSRGAIYRNQEPETIPYEIAEESMVDAFYPSLEDSIVTMDSPFILRDVRGTTLHFYPFHYNPVTQTIRFYRHITITLKEDDSTPVNPLMHGAIRTCSEAIAIYQSVFLNYAPTRKQLTQGEQGDILVITPSAYENAIEPYIRWKREMGYNVAKTVVARGTDVTSLIKNAYDNNNNLLYVQLVGDWNDIKSNTIYQYADGGDAPADPTMGCVAGNDVYPDIAIGRFSCNDAAQLAVQVEKAINYEKNPNMDAGWRETFIGIGSPSGSSDGDDYEADYVHIQRIFTERLQSFTYTTEKQNYGSNATAGTLASHINDGASTIAYCGHGSATGFGTTSFNNNNVNNLTNGDRLPFIVAAACKNGAFHQSSDCFAEAWLKKQNGGAVVTLMSSINQAWQPPQRGQDYFYDILAGGFNYANYSNQLGINTVEQRTHWGSIVINAFNLALTESNFQTDRETFSTWTTFGDVSLQLRTKQPDVITITNNELEEAIPFTATITTSGMPVPNALVCLSQNGNYISGYTNAIGEITLDHTFRSGEVLLVVTAFNTTTIYTTLDCTPGPTPELTLGSYFPTVVNSGTSTTLTLAMVNTGAAATTDLTSVTISCNDPVLAITDGAGMASPMASWGGVAAMNNEFQVYVPDNVATGSVFNIKWTATVGDSSWTGTFPLCVNNSSCSAPAGVSAFVSNNNVTLNWNAESTLVNVTLTDDAEGHTYGTINSAGNLGWSYIDGDGANTAILPCVLFSHAGSKMANIALDDDRMLGISVVQAHSGHKYFGFPASLLKSLFRAPQNDDWMISPRLDYDAPITFAFYARSYSSILTKEKFYAAYSTSGKNASDFINLTSSAVTTKNSWTKYTYTVPANAKYVAIHCVSSTQYMFCVDDIVISSQVAEDETYNIYRNGQLIAAGVTGGTFTDANLPDGNYCYTITHNCGNGDETLPSEPVCVSVVSTHGTNCEAAVPCENPENIVCVSLNNKIGLSWDEVEGALAYDIYRNGSRIATTYSHYYTDENVNPNYSYNYEVKTFCGNSRIYPDVAARNLTHFADDNPSDIVVYPNPAQNVLNVKGSDIQEICIYSAVGSLVRRVRPMQETTQISIGNLGSGIYFVRIYTPQKQFTEKVVIRN